jgi:methyl-accepting chemotaxis protein
MNARRIVGFIIMLTAVVGVILSVAGIFVGRDAIDRLGDQLDNGLTTTSETLDNLTKTLELTQDTLNQVSDSMDTLEQAALNVSRAMDDTRPMVKEIGQIVTGDVADAIESVQAAIGPLVDLTTTIDQVLKTLSEFKIEQTILGIPIAFDLGIEYDPDASLPDTVQSIADSIAGIPETLRDLSTSIETADRNLGVISTDLALIAGDVSEIKTSLSELPDLVDGFLGNVDSAQKQVQDIQTKLRDSWQLIKSGLLVFLVWLGLTQIAPFLWGYEMFTGRQLGEREE